MWLRREQPKQYVICLVANPPIKTTLAWFSEPMASCFVRVPYVVFALPLAMTELGSKEPEVALRAGVA